MAIKRRSVDLGAHPLAGEFIDEPRLPKFSEQELEFFGERLQDFMEEREMPAKGNSEAKTFRVLNFNEAAAAYGAVKKRDYMGKPVYEVRLKAIDFDSYGNPTGYAQPSLYERFVDKLDQYIAMVSRREFIEKKKIEGLQELADSMGVEHTPDEVELAEI